jgi:pilus assembly protein CpaC
MTKAVGHQFLIALVVLLFCVASPGLAQVAPVDDAIASPSLAQAPQRPRAASNVTTTRPTPPVQVVGPQGGIVIEAGRGAMLRLRGSASTVFVADPDTADVQVRSPELIYVFGRRPGETTLYATDARNGVLANLTVTVTHNLSQLRQTIRTVAGAVPVEAQTVGDSILLTGPVASPSQAEQLFRMASRVAGGDQNVVNRLQVQGSNQVNLRVRIVEMQRELLRAVGLNWDAAFSQGNFVLGLFTGRSLIGAAGTVLQSPILLRQPVLSESVQNAVFQYRGGSISIDGLLDLLEREGVISILAEPNLTALSGETASFLAGGEFPIPVAQSSGTGNAITVEFKRFGVGLAFTPTVLESNRISMKVRPEVSQLSTEGAVTVQGITVSALSVRRAETTVELGAGQSFAIAGLLQNRNEQNFNRLPGLGELPVLGGLFRSSRFRRSETELVIIVTPFLVQPVSGPRLATPIDGLIQPNETERIVGGAAYRQQLPPAPPGPRSRDASRLIGPAGFQLQ